MPHHAGAHAVHSHDGCNMNDSSYPFRGDYRVDQVVNHGHGGTWKAAPTGLSLKITGTNLKLESISASKANVLSCELGVGNLKPRPVVFAAGGPSMDVPGDLKEYHVNATVSGSRSKHYCHLTLLSYGDHIGSDGNMDDSSAHRALTMTVHPQLPPVLLEVNGSPITPRGGAFRIPTRASTLQLIPGASVGPPLPGKLHLHVLQGTDSSAAITLPSGEDLLLNPDRNPYVEIPLVGNGMLRLRLPRVVNSLDFTGSSLQHADALDVDIRTTADHRGGINVTIAATGIDIEAIIDGRPTQGYSSVSFSLYDPSRKFATVILALRDPATHRLLLRQTLQFPLGFGDAGNASSIHPSLRVEETSAGPARLLFTPYDGFISVDGGTQTPGHQGVSVDCSQPRTITVTQRSPEGTSCSAQVSLPAKANENQKWLQELAAVLEDQSKPLDQLQASLSAIRPPSQAAQRVLHGVARMLARPVPNIEFQIQGPNLISGVGCPSYNLAVAHGNAAPCITPPGGSVQLHSTQPTRVMALDTRGQVSASVTLRPSNVTAAPEDQLVKDMLDTTRNSAAAQHGPVDYANRLLSITTTSANGQLLLPEMAALIKRYSDGRSLVQAQDSILQCNVEQNSGLVGAVQFDGQPSRQLSFNTAISFPGSTKYVTLKITRSGSMFDQELLDTYKRSEPALLSRRWGEQVHPVDAKEQELLTALIALAKDIEGLKSNERRGTGPAPSIAPISFVCGDGMLTNIRSDGMQLSAYVDDMSSIGVGQGGQVPQGVPFIDGSHHRVRLVARDSMGAVRGEVFAVISGAKSLGASGGISYLDAAVLPEKGNVRVKLTSPPAYRIHCDIDNTRGEASTANEASFVVDGTKAHVIGVNVSDGQGAVVFQQRLQVPMMVAPSWSLALQGNVLTLIPSPSDRGLSVTAAVDQQHERVMDSPQIRLDHDVGHQVILRKYFGENTSPVGELLLRLSHFVDPDDTIAATKALQNSAPLEVKAVADRTNSGILRRLLGELLGKFGHGGGVMEDFYRKSTTVGAGGPSASPTVFFRLRGDEEKSSHQPRR